MGPINVQVIPLSEVPNRILPEDKPFLLIVDDEYLVADTLTTILKREGFDVKAAYNGASALKMASERAPALMVTDVAMPGMNGVELAQAVRTLCPDCKILLFSGHSASGSIVASSGHQFRMLTKPLHPTILLEYISRELGLPEHKPLARPHISSLTQAE